MTEQNELPEGDEGYLESEPTPRRVLDESLLREPISTLGLHEPVCVDREVTVAAAIALMQERHIGCVLVTHEERLVGIFTERDVLNDVVGRAVDPAEMRVSELMTPDPETLPSSAPIARALNKMSLGGFRHLPVVDAAGRPVSVISVKDVVDYLVDFFAPDILNLPPEHGLEMPKNREGA
jgi:CBS domain-containing protein